jgi:prepilin-type processing-associated H-X9-DG protein
LIELLMVILVIGVLAGLLLSALSLAKRKVREAQCVSNLHQLGTGLHAILSESHSYPLYAANTNANPEEDRVWVARLEREGLGISRPATNYYQRGIWRCPSAQGIIPFGDPNATFYSYNGWGLWRGYYTLTQPLGLGGHSIPDSGGSATRAEQLPFMTPTRESEVVNPTDMMAISDGFKGSDLLVRRTLAYLSGPGNTLARHRGKANVVFCDGHVESPTLKFIFEDTSDAALVRWNRDHLPHRDRL